MGHFAESFVFNGLTSISFRTNRELPESSVPGEARAAGLRSFWKTVTDSRWLVKTMSIFLNRAPRPSTRALRIRLLTESDVA
jgi:hypothetical protein